MSFALSLQEGEFLVKLARKAVETFVTNRIRIGVPRGTDSKLLTKCGVFVTLEAFMASSPERELRGCIGYPLPDHPLAEATIDSAVSACSEDFRFPPVRSSELSEIVIEVSVLTPPALIKVDDPKVYPSKIKVGRSGLMVERGWNKGLLLPQVPVEWGWDEEQFLAQCCVKAGLPPNEWLKKTTKVYAFEGLIFQELEPRGKVVQRSLQVEREGEKQREHN